MPSQVRMDVAEFHDEVAGCTLEEFNLRAIELLGDEDEINDEETYHNFIRFTLEGVDVENDRQVNINMLHGHMDFNTNSIEVTRDYDSVIGFSTTLPYFAPFTHQTVSDNRFILSENLHVTIDLADEVSYYLSIPRHCFKLFGRTMLLKL